MRRLLIVFAMVSWTLLAAPGSSQQETRPDRKDEDHAAPRLGTWIVTCIDRNVAYKSKLVLVARHGNRYDGFENSTQPNGPLVTVALSLEYSPEDRSVRIDQRQTCTRASASEVAGGVLSMTGRVDAEGSSLVDLRVIGTPDDLKTSARWVGESVAIKPAYLRSVITDPDEVHQLLQQWSGNVTIDGRRYLTGRDYALLKSLTHSKNAVVRDGSATLLELASFAGERESPTPAEDLECRDRIPREIFKAAFKKALVPDDGDPSLRSIVEILSAPFEAHSRDQARRLGALILAQRSTNTLCRRLEEEVLKGVRPSLPKPDGITVSCEVVDGDVVLVLRNHSGVALHDCYLRTRLVIDQSRADEVERDYWTDNAAMIALFEALGLHSISGAIADKVMMDFQRLDKYRPHFVHEWAKSAVLRVELQRLDSIVRIGDEADVLLIADEGACSLPVSIEDIRKKHGAVVSPGR
ncbi:MAG: hypothetical protein H6807_09975 [Planctomycetes bacterium]|nr:hypothetical protein [Planctomycetota bacterium]